VKKLVGSVPVALLALFPLVATAAAPPTPSPSLDQILLAPPAGYLPVATTPIKGRFTATQYTSHYGEQAVQAEHALKGAGFVDGYGMTWTQKSTRRVLVEFVIAFSGGAGARSWLAYEEAADKAKPAWKKSNPLPGIDPYYGGHFVSGATTSDLFEFVKGNDLFSVGFYSPKNDVLALATTQATNQYGAAPSSTIPTDQWPENATRPAPTSGAAVSLPNMSGVLPYLLAMTLAIGLLAVAAGMFLRWTRWRSAPRSLAIQLSPDGSHWWDGRTWHESAREAPPFAQRSGDGGYWWDGHSWRPVPLTSQTAGFR
jgi:hypothetical protein